MNIDLPEITYKALKVGDYLIENGNESLLIERKEIHDFTASYQDLKDRMDRMRASYERTALLLEGVYAIHDGYIYLWRGNKLYPSMPERTFYNFKLSQQERGSYFDRTNDLRETLRLISFWHEYIPLAGKRPVRKSKSATEWLAQLPGVGPLTSFGLREKYITPCDAISKMNEWLPKKARETMRRW